MARYDAFLLRIWRSGDEENGRWALRLEHLPEGQTLRFTTIEALLAHLYGTLPHGHEYQPAPSIDKPTADSPRAASQSIDRDRNTSSTCAPAKETR